MIDYDFDPQIAWIDARFAINHREIHGLTSFADFTDTYMYMGTTLERGHCFKHCDTRQCLWIPLEPSAAPEGWRFADTSHE